MNVADRRRPSAVPPQEVAMEESAFEVDSRQLAETSLRFPASRLAPVASQPDGDVSYLRVAAGAEFGRHAWDEAGRP
jgi:hypothetical protein